MQTAYSEWFSSLIGVAPHCWQGRLAECDVCDNRLIRVPTGMGKTLGVLSAWLYHRVAQNDERWPRRLVWCLPMRTLVEQTADEVRKIVKNMEVSVHVVMGGVDIDDWYLHPEAQAVLIGTQDMLLSRALNRGYAAPRARWPMEFGLLNNDCLWVLDEVQLMDVGLTTTAQLQQFRNDDGAKVCRPSYSWWMSATLQPQWLESVDTKELVYEMTSNRLGVPDEERVGHLWDDVMKPLTIAPACDDKGLATLVRSCHEAQTGGSRLTLVVVNTVKRANAVYGLLCKDKQLKTTIRLVHSRFRQFERRQWREEFLNREACLKGDSIIIATQVVEAGVDISASCLITDLAPWSSLVQRFGRAARYGGQAVVQVVDIDTVDEKRADKNAAPYLPEELDASRLALEKLQDVTAKAVDLFEGGLDPEALGLLYPYQPQHVLLRSELDELFDTTPDLTGMDLDISRFIRSGVERDCLLFWRKITAGCTPDPLMQPVSDELCSAPLGDVRGWLKSRGGNTGSTTWLWVWDYLDGVWRNASDRDIYPGRVFCVHADAGGYDCALGFQPGIKDRVVPIPLTVTDCIDQLADGTQDSEALSVVDAWQSIATHGRLVAQQAGRLTSVMGVRQDVGEVIDLAARLHDVGKAHPAFQQLIANPEQSMKGEVAKAPASAWPAGLPRYGIETSNGFDTRPGFRPELASALAIFDLLHQVDPLHDALLGRWQELFGLLGQSFTCSPSTNVITPIQEALKRLDAGSFDLLVYLVASHHGKVRAGFHAAPADQDHPVSRVGDEMPIRGVMAGDTIPAVHVAGAKGETCQVPETRLTLAPAGMGLSPVTGMSWAERVRHLLDRHGPFCLAWLEMVVRVADIRASRGDHLGTSSEGK